MPFLPDFDSEEQVRVFRHTLTLVAAYSAENGNELAAEEIDRIFEAGPGEAKNVMAGLAGALWGFVEAAAQAEGIDVQQYLAEVEKDFEDGSAERP